MPKNAPVSIIPSRPMFTTPLRSEKRPPIAAKVSGVAFTSIAAISADHTTTSSRLPRPACVASTPSDARALRRRRRPRRAGAGRARPSRRRRRRRPRRGRAARRPSRARPAAARARRRAHPATIAEPADHVATRSRRRRFQSQSTSTSAPTKSTTRPWMISVRLLARSGRKTVGVEIPRRGPRQERAEEQRREEDADRAVPAEHARPRSPMKPISDVWMSRHAKLELPAEHVDRAGEAGEGARDRHRRDVRARDADARVARRLGIEADGAQLEAERRAIEEQRSRRRGRRARRRSRCGAPAAAGSPRRRAGASSSATGVRDRGRAAVRVALQRAALPDELAADPDGDPVQHDRRDHLVRAGERLQEPGDARVRGAGERRRDDREHDVQRPVQAAGTTSRPRSRRSSRRGTGPGRRC